MTVSADKIQIMLRDAGKNKRPIEIPWEPRPKFQAQIQFAQYDAKPDPKLIKAIVRAQTWLDQLSSGHHKSIKIWLLLSTQSKSYPARSQAPHFSRPK